MVQQHVRRRLESLVGHTVLDGDRIGTQGGGNLSAEKHICAKHRRLPHLTLSPENAAVAPPLLTDLKVPTREVGVATVQAEWLTLVGARRSHPGQTACAQQAAAKRPQPSQTFRLVKRRMRLTARRIPRERGATVLG